MLTHPGDPPEKEASGRELAKNACRITIPGFIWGKIVRNFLQEIGMEKES